MGLVWMELVSIVLKEHGEDVRLGSSRERVCCNLKWLVGGSSETRFLLHSHGRKFHSGSTAHLDLRTLTTVGSLLAAGQGSGVGSPGERRMTSV